MKKSTLIPVSEAQAIILSETASWGSEIIPLERALNRVLTENISADRDYPPFNRSAVDGYAFSSADFKNGSTNLKVGGCIYAGAKEQKLPPGKAVKIMTGAPVPAGADVVLKVEDSEEESSFVNFKLDLIKKWQNIALKGEDLSKNEAIMNAGTELGPAQIATLAATGHAEIKVAKLPAVRIISTGNELVKIRQKVLSHQIRDSNYYSLLSFLQKYGIHTPAYSLIPDKESLLANAIASATEDILILSGGVSMGDADFVPDALEKAGFKKVFHKVAIKPGKPLWFGKKGNQIAFALPGNPVSVQVAWKLFIEPFIRSACKMPEAPYLILPFMSERIKKSCFDEFFPCQLRNEGLTYLKPAVSNGSGDIRSTGLSDGIAWHPADSPELVSGNYVKFFKWQ